MPAKLGRNEKCHCGSGKKYKHCHLREDEKAGVTEDDAFADSPPPMIKTVQELARKMEKRGGKKEQRLAASVHILAKYLEREREIDAAAKALEPYEATFNSLLRDDVRLMRLASDLFAEERFASLRFTPGQVEHAFDKVGGVPSSHDPEEFTGAVARAIDFLAKEEKRVELSMVLLLPLPEFVAEGRYMEAWMLQYCSYCLSEENKGLNPFLFVMFMLGYEAWCEQNQNKNKECLHELGIDPDKLLQMSPAELANWLEEQRDNPELDRRFKSAFAANPQLKSETIDQMVQAEIDSIKLLDREDAQHLLLSLKELEPHLPELEWALSLHSTAASVPTGTAEPDESLRETAFAAVCEVTRKVFTPERIEQLRSQLIRFEADHFAKGDTAAARLALGAKSLLNQCDDPAKNYFLLGVTMASLKIGADPDQS